MTVRGFREISASASSTASFGSTAAPARGPGWGWLSLVPSPASTVGRSPATSPAPVPASRWSCQSPRSDQRRHDVLEQVQGVLEPVLHPRVQVSIAVLLALVLHQDRECRAAV